MSNPVFNESACSKWTEEDLSKLSCKVLKELARESCVKTNSNYKKADLVRALLNSIAANVLFVDKSDIKENSRRGRMTRSRTSMFQPLGDMQDDLLVSNQLSKTIDTADEKEHFDEEVGLSNESKQKNKGRRKSGVDISIQNKMPVTANTSDIFKIVSSIQKNTRPFTEITNSDALTKKKSEQTNCNDKQHASKSKRTKGKNYSKNVSTENLSAEHEPLSNNESVENETEQVNSSATVSCDDRKTLKIMKGKGKRTKVADKSIKKSVESNKSVIEEQSIIIQAENKSAENEKMFEIPFSECNVDIKEEHIKSPFKISCDEKKPHKKTRGRGKKAKEPERNPETAENCLNIVKESSIVNQTQECLDKDKSPFEDNKRRKRNIKKSPELEEPSQNSESIQSPIIETCEPKKQRRHKKKNENPSEENYENADKKEVSVLANSLVILELKKQSINSEQSDSIVSDGNELSQNSSNSRKNRKSAECESESKILNSEVREDYSPQQTSLTENWEENKTVTDITPNSLNMPVRTSEVPSVIITDSAGFSRKTRNSLKINVFEPPLRSNTFIVEEGASDHTPRSSLSKNLPSHSSTFTVEEEGLPTKTTPIQLAPKIEKSIGKRILSVSMKQGHIKPLVKQTSGSTLKKSISKAKNTNTPGSVYKSKFGVAKKLPNFKSIHQKLFQNMESIGENKQRTMARAQALIASPAVPRCALLSPKPELMKGDASSKKRPIPGFLSPLVRTPAQTDRRTQTRTTPGPSAAPGSSTVNRFGFKKPVKRLESSTIRKKLSNTNLAKIKDQERQILQGVRMNKRFLLQMKMREGKP